jgi:hypothetical protein
MTRGGQDFGHRVDPGLYVGPQQAILHGFNEPSMGGLGGLTDVKFPSSGPYLACSRAYY